MASILITGATNGLGLALAEELAEAGHQLLLHGRDPQRLAPIAQRLGAEEYIADLSALAETQRLAAEVAARHARLDVLVNNAGVGFTWNGTTRSMSADGYEQRLAVNYLSPVLLTRELLPLLRAGSPSRIVNIASAAQEPIDFDDPQMLKEFTEVRAYSRSKLAMINWTADLAEELAGTGVTANSVHPATFMPTSIQRNSGAEAQDTLESGIAATRRLIESPELAEVSGRYYFKEEEKQPSHEWTLAPEYRRRLTDLTQHLLTSAGV
ncbi:SDR family NAD(P)-dependent oxidoreductase [Streptomyces sp. NPDC094472]|uniref:SDR family NAD(P)-dependent oxidoreductase n=1 Tax=Streptomyces sp. NPDC094472 TaxID=3155080 RepID=UPI00332BD5C1